MATSEPPPFRFVPRPPHVGALTVALALLLVGGGLAGFGIGCTVIDGYDDAPAAYVADGDIGAITIGAVVAVIVGVLMWSLMVDSHPLVLSHWHAWGTLLPASGLGLLAAALHLEVAGWYAVAAIGAAVLGVVALVLGSVAVARRRRRWRHEVDLIARGTPVAATVVDSGLDPGDFEEASNVITTVTVRFVGADGTAYRLHRRVTIPQHAPIVEGQRTTVWYDPEHPTDDRAMVVALQHALRWNVPVPEVGAPRPAVRS